ncbi:MAG: DMT family transporter, partial [Sulfurimonadaceae bacterium]|nr:DMT family transporter [Sulfurimonadaceae bacterium]
MNRPVIVLFAASVLWGLSWLPLKSINAMGIEGLLFSMGAYGILALALTPLFVRQKALWKQHKRAMLLIALFGGGANLAFTYALIYGDVIRVMVLFYLLPLWGVLGGHFFLKESIDGFRKLGVVLALGGAFLILGAFDVFDTPPTYIDLIALLSGLLFAAN